MSRPACSGAFGDDRRRTGSIWPVVRDIDGPNRRVGGLRLESRLRIRLHEKWEPPGTRPIVGLEPVDLSGRDVQDMSESWLLDRSQPGSDDEATLHLLRAVAEDPCVSQRHLATRLGLALGLTNAVIRRAVAKGWIKVRSAPTRRYSYYLTPRGFAEKSRLTLQYLEHSLRRLREGRNAFAAEFGACARQGWRSVAILGTSDMVDVALLGAQQAMVSPVAIINANEAGRTYGGIPIVADVAGARALTGRIGLDAIVFAVLVSAAERDAIAEEAGLSANRLLAPDFLRPHEVLADQNPPAITVAEG